MNVLYHVTTENKAQKYHQSGFIKKPVRGFSSLQAAMFWAMKTRRRVIYKIDLSKHKKNLYKLDDHHNQFGTAWWIDNNINLSDIKCVISPKKGGKK